MEGHDRVHQRVHDGPSRPAVTDVHDAARLGEARPDLRAPGPARRRLGELVHSHDGALRAQRPAPFPGLDVIDVGRQDRRQERKRPAPFERPVAVHENIEVQHVVAVDAPAQSRAVVQDRQDSGAALANRVHDRRHAARRGLHGLAFDRLGEFLSGITHGRA